MIVKSSTANGAQIAIMASGRGIRGTLLMGLVTRIGYPIDASADFLLASEP